MVIYGEPVDIADVLSATITVLSFMPSSGAQLPTGLGFLPHPVLLPALHAVGKHVSKVGCRTTAVGMRMCRGR